jgi:hypothetical protein
LQLIAVFDFRTDNATLCEVGNQSHRTQRGQSAELEFEKVTAASCQVAKVFQGSADSAATAALYERGWRSVRRIRDLDREAAALPANELEARLIATISFLCAN